MPQSRLIDTSASFTDQLLPLAGVVTYSHGASGEHAHAGWASTTWLDPTLATRHAKAVAAALERARPEDAASFVDRLAGLTADLEIVSTRSSGSSPRSAS